MSSFRASHNTLPPTCDRCDTRPAVGELGAQWTLVDFQSWNICGECLDEAYHVAQQMLVDGAQPLEITWDRWIYN